MLDSPRSFILIIASVVVAITLVVLGGKAFKSEENKSGDLNPTINNSERANEGANNKTAEKPKTTTTVTPTPKPSNTTPTPNVATNYTVTYTSSGFTPNAITIKAGKSVRFINQAGASMYVVASPNPSSNNLPEFDQGKSVGRGGYYDFTFNRPGTFIYYNNNKKGDTGVVTVTQ